MLGEESLFSDSGRSPAELYLPATIAQFGPIASSDHIVEAWSTALMERRRRAWGRFRTFVAFSHAIAPRLGKGAAQSRFLAASRALQSWLALEWLPGSAALAAKAFGYGELSRELMPILAFNVELDRLCRMVVPHQARAAAEEFLGALPPGMETILVTGLDQRYVRSLLNPMPDLVLEVAGGLPLAQVGMRLGIAPGFQETAGTAFQRRSPGSIVVAGYPLPAARLATCLGAACHPIAEGYEEEGWASLPRAIAKV